MRGVAVLGSTGSIGRSTLDVLRRQRDHFRLVALAAGQNEAMLAAQIAEWRPAYAGLAGGNGSATVPTGAQVLIDAATHPDVDIVVNAVVGAAGLDATLAALRAGKRVALANKESLVMAGELVADELDLGNLRGVHPLQDVGERDDLAAGLKVDGELPDERQDDHEDHPEQQALQGRIHRFPFNSKITMPDSGLVTRHSSAMA